MMRTRILSIVIIAFLMLLIPVNVASAKYSITLGYVHNNSTEYYLQTRLISLIINASLYRGYNTMNWHGSQTTVNHILDAATGLQQSNSIVFYIGHGYKICIIIMLLLIITNLLLIMKFMIKLTIKI